MVLAVVLLFGCPNMFEPAKDATITLLTIPGVTAPVTGASPVMILDTNQYAGTISWSPSVNGSFAGNMMYTAVVILSPKDGYTFTGVAANSFIVTGASSVTNIKNSGVVTAVFPTTSAVVSTNTYRKLTIQTTTINGTTQTTNAPEFTVAAGASISGSFNVLFETDFPSSNVFPLAASPNWGTKQSAYWQVSGGMNDGNSYSGNIALTAPSTSGTYYVILATMSEYTAEQIMSATHWGTTAVWNDGNDLFDLGSASIGTGISTGSLTHSMLAGSAYSNQSYGLTAIKVIVDGSNQHSGDSWRNVT